MPRNLTKTPEDLQKAIEKLWLHQGDALVLPGSRDLLTFLHREGVEVHSAHELNQIRNRLMTLFQMGREDFLTMLGFFLSFSVEEIDLLMGQYAALFVRMNPFLILELHEQDPAKLEALKHIARREPWFLFHLPEEFLTDEIIRLAPVDLLMVLAFTPERAYYGSMRARQIGKETLLRLSAEQLEAAIFLFEEQMEALGPENLPQLTPAQISALMQLNEKRPESSHHVLPEIIRTLGVAGLRDLKPEQIEALRYIYPTHMISVEKMESLREAGVLPSIPAETLRLAASWLSDEFVAAFASAFGTHTVEEIWEKHLHHEWNRLRESGVLYSDDDESQQSIEIGRGVHFNIACLKALGRRRFLAAKPERLRHLSSTAFVSVDGLGPRLSPYKHPQKKRWRVVGGKSPLISRVLDPVTLVSVETFVRLEEDVRECLFDEQLLSADQLRSIDPGLLPLVTADQLRTIKILKSETINCLFCKSQPGQKYWLDWTTWPEARLRVLDQLPVESLNFLERHILEEVSCDLLPALAQLSPSQIEALGVERLTHLSPDHLRLLAKVEPKDICEYRDFLLQEDLDDVERVVNRIASS